MMNGEREYFCKYFIEVEGNFIPLYINPKTEEEKKVIEKLYNYFVYGEKIDL